MTSGGRCAKCYEPLKEGVRFCPKCGTSTEQPAAPVTQVTGGENECPSCHETNPSTATFCRACGTQLQTAAAGHGHTPAPGQQAAPDQDPWASGAGYERPLSADASCPRCGSFRNPGETVCVSCGLPFGQQENYRGIPPAVAMRGDPAGFWIRLVAAFIDGVIQAIVVMIPVGLWLVGSEEFQDFIDSEGTGDFPIPLWLLLIVSAFQIAYPVFFHAVFGATPGKMLLNIRVYDASATLGLGFQRALIRATPVIIMAALGIAGETTLGLQFLVLLSYLVAAFRQDKRALHDLIAGTYPTIRRRTRY